MQKVLQRTAFAEKQAARRLAARKGKNASDERKLRENIQTQASRARRTSVHAERRARREDLMLGPLAPRRDVGDQRGVYGAIDSLLLRGVEKPEGKYRNWGIVEGDRVVMVTAGALERGQIGVVKEVQRNTEMCVVEGFNKAYVEVPEYLLINEVDKTPIRPYDRPIPLSSVRLVAALPHPETGVLRDVVINELKLRRTTLRELSGDDEPSRFVAGLSPATRVPYPPTPPEEEATEHEGDTLRIEVEQATWVPTLLAPPMPPRVIDELRNRYGKFRDRHDAAYVAKKTAEAEAEAARARSTRLMDTPLKELHRKVRAEKRALGKPVLGEDMLEQIGQVMASKGRELSEEASLETS